MSDPRAPQRKRLQILERWRTAQLDEAQATHAQLSAITTQKETGLKQLRTELDDTQEYLRERVVSGGSLAPELLRGFSQFSAQQLHRIESAAAEYEEAHANSEAARADVRQHFERLSVVQKLSERRDFEASKEDARLDQKRIDEQALSRLAAPSAGNPTKSTPE